MDEANSVEQDRGGDRPLFVLIDQSDGHRWELYEDGRVTGFPDGVGVLNYALPLLQSLRAKQGPTSPISSQES